MRPPNEIDFWRGFALVTIFINHVPGLFYERFTHRNFSLSDSAELFVFLAGWSLRFVVRAEGRISGARLTLRLFGRTVSIYAAQTVITLMALALIAAASVFLDAPLILEWHNAGPVFQDPVETHIGLVLLTHQLGYFNILPLYVVLMVVAPVFALLDRVSHWFLFAVSGAVWLVTLVTAINLPTWPVEGRWFFDPLCWQFIFVLGFLVADPEGPGAVARWLWAHLRWAAGLVVLAGAVAALSDWSPDPLRVPEPHLLFMFDKTFLSPARVIQFCALVLVVAGLYRLIPARLAPVVGYLSMLGRNSLGVFCVASVLSLAAQIERFVYGSGLGADTIVLIVGLLAMGFSAWLSEWRERFGVRAS
jgi:hypothetical protein